MRLALKSLLVPLLALVPFVHTAAQGLDASGGFNPVPYLAADVDSARQAYEDAQAKRDLALDKKRATGNAYNHALDRAEVKDDAREKAREEARKKFEAETAARNGAPKPPPEFGSAEDFQLAQALNRLKGKTVLVSKTAVERKAEVETN